MARILIVGNATLDIVNSVECYPKEDQEVRACAQQITRGGNAANTAVVLSQLGHECHWAGTLAQEPDGGLIRADLLHYGVNLDQVHTIAEGKVPTSYIVRSRENGSRTIVHYRDLPEYPYESFASINLDNFDWLHFEGRNVEQLESMMRRAREQAPQLFISLEVEKHRQGMERLMSLADLLLFSRDYAVQQGYEDAVSFLQQFATSLPSIMLSCTWGKEGAWARDSDGESFHAAAHQPAQIIDTLGAGDTFNAGIIDRLVEGDRLEDALQAATRLAGIKCGILGLKLDQTKL